MQNLESYKFFQQLKQLLFIDNIFLYGSRARGDFHEKSDWDIAIDCPRASNADWQIVLDVIAQADSLLKIDCVRFDTLHPTNSLRQHIASSKHCQSNF